MKLLVLWVLYYIGFVRVWCLFRGNRITILTLHGVMDDGVVSEWKPLRARTSRKLFDETLGLAIKYFNFVSMDDAVSMLLGRRPLTKNACVVTIDDGQVNNIQIALPILRKYNIPVLLYPTTGPLERSFPYWFDRLDFAVQQPGLDGVEITVEKSVVKIDQSSRENALRSLSMLIRRLKSKVQSDAAFLKEVDGICAYFEKLSGKELASMPGVDLWSATMTADDIAECSKFDDVTIGCHTVNHMRLPFLEEEELNAELMDSKRRLEEVTGESCVHFCYPNGDWNERSAIAVQQAGYVSAVTTDVGSNAVGDNLYALKRYSFPAVGTAIKVLFSICGILHFASDLRKRWR